MKSPAATWNVEAGLVGKISDRHLSTTTAHAAQLPQPKAPHPALVRLAQLLALADDPANDAPKASGGAA